MDSLQKSCYASILKANPKANELLGFENFENFKETWWGLQKLLELPEFNELYYVRSKINGVHFGKP